MADNPPAFPVPDAALYQAHGLTMRDYFAAHAPPIPDAFEIEVPECSDWSCPELSRQAWVGYQSRRAVAWCNYFADAMLAARTTS